MHYTLNSVHNVNKFTFLLNISIVSHRATHSTQMALFLENDPATVRASSSVLGSSLCQCELDHSQTFSPSVSLS